MTAGARQRLVSSSTLSEDVLLAWHAQSRLMKTELRGRSSYGSVPAAKKSWLIAVRVVLCLLVTRARWVGWFVIVMITHAAFGKP